VTVTIGTGTVENIHGLLRKAGVNYVEL
jgi:hypothetical protein